MDACLKFQILGLKHTIKTMIYLTNCSMEFQTFMRGFYVAGDVPKCVGEGNVFHKEFLSDRSVAGRGDSIFATREEKENQVRFTRSEIKNRTV